MVGACHHQQAADVADGADAAAVVCLTFDLFDHMSHMSPGGYRARPLLKSRHLVVMTS